MKRRLGLALALVLLATPTAVLATRAGQVPFERVWRIADRVVLASVEEVSSQVSEGLPWTVATLVIEETLSGFEVDRIEVAQLGGNLTTEDGSSRTLSVPGLVEFQVGQRVIVALYLIAAETPIVGVNQGYLLVGEDGRMRDAYGRPVRIASGRSTVVEQATEASAFAEALAEIRRILGGGS
jgi:hypothetical protein